MHHVELIARRKVDEPLERSDAEPVPRDVDSDAAPCKARRILDVHGGVTGRPLSFEVSCSSVSDA